MLMKKYFHILMLVLMPLAGISQENKENTDYRLSVSLYNDKLYDLALEQFRRFVELYPNTQQGILARFYIAESQFQLKKFEEAKTAYQNFALSYQLHPQAPEAWWKIGECNFNLNKINDAAIAFERIKVFHPTSELAPKGLLRSSDCYSLLNDFGNAERTLRTLLSEYLSSEIQLNARQKLANIYIRQNQYQKAIDEYKTILNSDISKDAKSLAQISLGRLLAATGKISAAEQIFKEIIINNSLNPIADSAKIEIGKLFVDIGDYGNAKIYFMELVDTTGKKSGAIDKIAVFQLANSEYQLKNYLSALKYIQTFEEKYSSAAEISELWFIAAETNRKLSDYLKSNEYFKKIIDQPAENNLKKKAFLYYCQNCIDIRNFNEAIEYYNIFLEKYPNDPLTAEILFRQGKIYLDYLRDYRRAVTKFDEIITKQRTNLLTDDALFYLANAYELNKELDKALQKYHELTKNYSNSSFYETALDKINNINLFVSTNNTDGFKKIGILLQDVISNKPKGELSYKLGEVYYNDMRDYKSALAQFDIALTSNGLSDSLKSLAQYYKMMSVYYIAISEGTSSEEAVNNFNQFLSANPNTPKKMDIVLKLFELSKLGKNESEVLTLAMEYYEKYKELKIGDVFLYDALNISIKKNDPKTIISTGTVILKDYPSSAYVEDAVFACAYGESLIGRDTTAEKMFAEYVSNYPQGRHLSGAYLGLANIYRRKNEPQKALEYFNKIKNLFAYTTEAEKLNELYADSYFESGDFKSSFRSYSQIYQTASENIYSDQESLNSYIFKMAASADKSGDKENAKKYYTRYILRNTDGKFYNQSLLNLGLIYHDEENNDASAKYFNMIKPSASDPEMTFRMAEILFSAGEYKHALTNYKMIVNSTVLEKSKRGIQYKIILANFKTGNLNDAVAEKKSFSGNFKLNYEEEAEILYEEALYYYGQKNNKQAQDLFADVVDDYPKSEKAAWAAYYIGRILESTDKLPDAQKSYNWAIQQFPNSEAAANANLVMGNYFFRSEKFSESLKFFKSIADREPKDQTIYAAALDNLIEAAFQLQLYDASIEYCRKYINKFPNDKSIPEKRLKIGILYQKLRYFDQAIVHYQTLLNNAAPDLEVEIRYYLGECYFSKGDFSTALIEFMKIPYISGKLIRVDWIPASLYMAGQSYEKLNKYEQAITMYNQIIEKPNIDATYKAQAQKEIDRVKALLIPNEGNK